MLVYVKAIQCIRDTYCPICIPLAQGWQTFSVKGQCQSVQAAAIKYHRWVAYKSEKSISYTVLEVRSARSRHWHGQVLVRSLLFHSQRLLAVSPHRRGKWSPWGLLQNTNPTHEGLTRDLSTSEGLPLLRPSSLEVRISTCESETHTFG